MCADMCIGTRTDMRTDTCIDMCMGMRIDARAEMCTDVRVDTCAEMCIEMCVGREVFDVLRELACERPVAIVMA